MASLRNFFLIICITMTSTCISSSRNLIVLLDCQYETIEKALQVPLKDDDNRVAFVQYMLKNIEQQAAPMLITASLWRNYRKRTEIVEDAIKPVLRLSDQQFLKHYRSEKFSTIEDVQQFRNACRDGKMLNYTHSFLYCFDTKFDPNAWIVSKISDIFYLFVPKRYINELSAQPEPNKLIRPHIDKEELQLGLKYVSGKLTAIDRILHSNNFNAPCTSLSTEFVRILPDLFVTRNDVAISGTQEEKEKNYQTFLHSFDLIGGGHGDNAVRIMGASKNAFKLFLQFLNDYVKARFLFFTTCSAGAHFNDITLDQRYNFFIAAATFFSARTTMGRSLEEFSFLRFFQLLNDYFSVSEKTIEQYVTLKDVLKNVMLIGRAWGSYGEWQLPAILPPGNTEFEVIDLNNMQKISPSYVREKEEKGETIRIENKQVVLLSGEHFQDPLLSGIRHLEIKVPVSIDCCLPEKTLSFFAMSPEPLFVYFDTVYTNQGLFDTITSFLPMPQQIHRRVFYIKTLHCANDLTGKNRLALGAQPHLTKTNVTIVQNGYPLFQAQRNELPIFDGFYILGKQNVYSNFWYGSSHKPEVSYQHFLKLYNKEMIIKKVHLPDAPTLRTILHSYYAIIAGQLPGDSAKQQEALQKEIDLKTAQEKKQKEAGDKGIIIVRPEPQPHKR